MALVSNIRPLLCAAAVAALFAAPQAGFCAGEAPLAQRAATGDITQWGGARRLQNDQTQLLRDSIKKRTAKNVILLIGDGMGDSEITAARNFARGAAGAFPGLDALPVTF